MTLYGIRYRIKSARLANWDYSTPAYYFVTICTNNRRCFFGQIEDGTMVLSMAGKLAHEEWRNVTDGREDVKLDEFIIMPNHMHAIVILRQTSVETHLRGVSTRSASEPTCLSSLIRQFKSSTTRLVWAAGLSSFGWQSRFHDRIIRSDRSLEATRQYVVDNPLKWELDRENPRFLKPSGRRPSARSRRQQKR